MGPLLLFLLIAVWVFALIAVHEIGHFILGWVGGLPPRDMKLRLLVFPQHVALRDGAEWISPVRDIRRYVDITRRHFRTRAAAFAWVAGGMALELLWTGAVCAAALLAGYRELAIVAACVSLGMYAINVVLMDLPWALRHRNGRGGHVRPLGDRSGPRGDLQRGDGRGPRPARRGERLKARAPSGSCADTHG